MSLFPLLFFSDAMCNFCIFSLLEYQVHDNHALINVVHGRETDGQEEDTQIQIPRFIPNQDKEWFSV